MLIRFFLLIYLSSSNTNELEYIRKQSSEGNIWMQGNEETRGWRRLNNYKCIINKLHLAQGNMDFTFLRGTI
jgi:hypothetical protein